MLQVAVHNHNRVPACHGQSSKNGRLFPEVPGEFGASDTGVLRRSLLYFPKGAVAGAVAYKHQFILYALLVQKLRQYLHSVGNVLLLVVCRQHNG